MHLQQQIQPMWRRSRTQSPLLSKKNISEYEISNTTASFSSSPDEENIQIIMKLDALADSRYHCSDVYCRFRLVGKEGDFVETSKQAASLSETFTGNIWKSKLILHIEIDVVPSSGNTSNIMILSYSLSKRVTGRVVITKTVRISGDGRNTKVQKLEDELKRIERDIAFVCCSRIPEWKQVATHMLLED